MDTTNNKTAPRNGTASKKPRAHCKQSDSFNKAALARKLADAERDELQANRTGLLSTVKGVQL